MCIRDRFRRASWDERRWSRQDGVTVDSGFDGPGGVAAVLCSVVQGTGTADVVVVKGSVAHRKFRRRGGYPGRARRVRLLSPTPQGNHWNKGISLEQAIHVGAGLEG